MKRIQSTLFAIGMLLAAPAVLTSCQEDAPEINYTMNVTVNNDFSEVVKAINNGTIKMEDAVGKLISAIDQMKATQAEKLQMLIDVITNQNNSIESKLAAIEAAIRAQTLSIESKLQLLEEAIKALPDYSSQLQAIMTAINNLPDYGDKLTAIQTAINALPDYGSKFDALTAALNAIKTQVEANGQAQSSIATKLGDLITAINNLIAEVKSGNKSEADALAEIIKKLEDLKGSVGGGSGTGGDGGSGTGGDGGSGTGGDGGSGTGGGTGTGPVGEDVFEGAIENGTTLNITQTIYTGSAWIDLNENGVKDEGEDLEKGAKSYEVKTASGSGKFTIHGDLSYLQISRGTMVYFKASSNNLEILHIKSNQLSSIDLNCPKLKRLDVQENRLTQLDLSKCPNLKEKLYISSNQISGANMDALIKSLPNVTTNPDFRVMSIKEEGEMNKMTVAQVEAAKAKGWTPKWLSPIDALWHPYEGE